MKSEKVLSDYAEVIVGFPFKSSNFNLDGKGQRLVRGANVSSQEIRWGDDTRWYEFTDYPDYCELKEGDIVIGMDGSRVGKNYSRISASDLPCLLVQRVACIRAKAGFNQDFVWACLTLGLFERYVDSIKTGTTIPHISLTQIENCPMPDISETMQERIGQLCSLFDTAIHVNSRINDYLSSL